MGVIQQAKRNGSPQNLVKICPAVAEIFVFKDLLPGNFLLLITSFVTLRVSRVQENLTAFGRFVDKAS